ncbi:MAG: SRPBCC family protein, partial [Pseudomonadota bacterium]
MPYASRIVSQPVAVHADVVYDYAHIIENLPQWASGLAAGVQQRDGVWYTESPMGHVRLDMAPKNAFRVLDHDVTLPDGTVVHNAL